jgi:hypothetical protein
MIADFDSRTLANMQVALERACKILSTEAEEHWARRHIASKIVECAEGCDKTLNAMTAAGRAAAHELCATVSQSYAISSIMRALRGFARMSRLLRAARLEWLGDETAVAFGSEQDRDR